MKVISYEKSSHWINLGIYRGNLTSLSKLYSIFLSHLSMQSHNLHHLSYSNLLFQYPAGTKLVIPHVTLELTYLSHFLTIQVSQQKSKYYKVKKSIMTETHPITSSLHEVLIPIHKITILNFFFILFFFSFFCFVFFLLFFFLLNPTASTQGLKPERLTKFQTLQGWCGKGEGVHVIVGEGAWVLIENTH